MSGHVLDVLDDKFQNIIGTILTRIAFVVMGMEIPYIKITR